MEQRKFLAMVGTLAQADMQKSGILASLTIAQAILESGWGTSELATKANALFGIKADARWSGRAYSKIWPRLLFVLNGGRDLFCYAERLTKAPQTAIFEWYCVLKLHRTAEADTGSTDIGEEETQCEPIST